SFFRVAPPTEIYTLSLHDALPIFAQVAVKLFALVGNGDALAGRAQVRQRAVAALDGLHMRPLHLRRIDDEEEFAEVVADCRPGVDRKSTRLNSSHQIISYAVFCLK